METARDNSNVGNITAQQLGWMRAMQEGNLSTKTIQYENTYEGQDHPHKNRVIPNLESWHPQPSMLNLEFTFSGDWVKVPKYRNQDGGPDYLPYRLGRKEKYIDIDGNTRSAV